METIDEDKVKSIVSEMLRDYASLNKADENKIKTDDLEFLVNNKVDARNVMDYTFAGTGPESFEHNLGRVPKGVFVISASASRDITGDPTSWTAKRITLTSPSAANLVRFLFL